jgi:hypothetical protein
VLEGWSQEMKAGFFVAAGVLVLLIVVAVIFGGRR